MSKYKTVIVEQHGPVAVVSLNRPDKLNSFDGVLRAALQLFVAMPDNVVLLRGNHEYFVWLEDRIYSGVQRPLLLREPQQSLGINIEGFPDVVVWNPWEHKCAALPDMAASDFRRMLCVEAAQARRPQELEAGERWHGRQSLVVLS